MWGKRTIAMAAFAMLAGGGCTSILGIGSPGVGASGDDDVVGPDAAPGTPDAAPPGTPDAPPGPGTPDAAAADAAPPDASPADVQGSSCLDILDRFFGSPSGVYVIDPDGPEGFAPPIQVYCDMTTDPGGWTLVLAYDHHGGTNPPLQPGVPPLDPNHGFSHFSSAQLHALAYDRVRFFCRSDAHERHMDFRTGDVTAVAYVHGTSSSVLSAWNQGFQSTIDHTAHLPQAATAVHNCPDPGVCGLQDRLTSKPFFKPGVYHWSIGDAGAWECDDAPGNASETTLHQVWAR